MNKLYFYIFRDNQFNVLECKEDGNKYILSNGKTRIKKDNQFLNIVYGKACEVIMYSNSNDNLEMFFKGAIAFINKQLSKQKRIYDRCSMNDENEKLKKLSEKIGKYHNLLKDVMLYQVENNIG